MMPIVNNLSVVYNTTATLDQAQLAATCLATQYNNQVPLTFADMQQQQLWDALGKEQEQMVHQAIDAFVAQTAVLAIELGEQSYTTTARATSQAVVEQVIKVDPGLASQKEMLTNMLEDQILKAVESHSNPSTAAQA